MTINFGLLNSTPIPDKVQTMQTGGSTGGSDLGSGLTGLLKGLKSAFGPNNVSNANQAISSSLSQASPNQLASSLVPSLVPQQPNPGTALNKYQGQGAAPGQGPAPIMQSPQSSILGALQNPQAPQQQQVQGQGNTPDTNSILDHTMQSIAHVESGGERQPYETVTKIPDKNDASYGKYQILGSNIPQWTKAATGKAMTVHEFLADHQAQDATAKYQMTNMLKQYGNPQDVASAWFTGRPLAKAGLEVKDSTGVTNGQYQDKFSTKYNQLAGQATNPTTIAQAHTQPVPNITQGIPVPKQMEQTPAFQSSMQAYASAVKNGTTKSQYVVNVDFNQPATAKRLSVINAHTGQIVMQSEVAQGSGGFSNKPGSHGSETGTFQATQTYDGKHGYSMKIKGLDQGVNDNVDKRDIVVHGANYIGNGKTGHSFGCFAVPQENAAKLINLIKGGTIIHASGPQMRTSLNNEQSLVPGQSPQGTPPLQQDPQYQNQQPPKPSGILQGLA
jgi:hypothetical protein